MQETTQGSAALYKRLLGYVGPYKWAFAGAIFAMAIGGVVEGAFPYLLKLMLETLFVEGNEKYAWIASFAVVAVFLTTGVSHFVAGYGMQWVGNKIMLDMRSLMYKKLIRLPVPTFDAYSSGELLSRITNDVMGVQAAATTALTMLVRSSFTLIGLLVTLFVLNWRLTLITLIAVPILAVVINLFGKRLRALSVSGMAAQAEMLDIVRESVVAQRVIKISGGEAHESQRFDKSANTLRQLIMKQSIAAAASTPITHFVVSIAIGAIIYLAASKTLGEPMPMASFITFIIAAAALVPQIKQLASVNEQIQRGLAASTRVFALIDAHAETDTGEITLSRAKGMITFDNVSLNYTTKNALALDGVSLMITPGETIALVGPSGGGKTSLVNLVPRFFTPTSGTIYVDDIAIEKIKMKDLREQIALVSQDVVLFNDTVAANIAYGKSNIATAAAIEAAARAANCMDFIQSLPQGFDTIIGENGARLSGGQRQRLAIARAILKDAPILLLDEATSALDSESERAVQDALETLMRGRTTIVVAHRLSTIENASRIAVLEGGKIVEIGTHTELLAANKLYAGLYRLQFAG